MVTPHETSETPGFRKTEQIAERSLYPTVYRHLMDKSLTMVAQLTSGASTEELQYLFTNQFPPPQENTQIEDPWGFFSGYMHIGLLYARLSQATQEDPTPLPLPQHPLQHISPTLYSVYQQHALITQQPSITPDEGRFIEKSLSQDPTGEVFLLGQMQSEDPKPSQQWGMMQAIQEGAKEYTRAHAPVKPSPRRLNIVAPPTP